MYSYLSLYINSLLTDYRCSIAFVATCRKCSATLGLNLSTVLYFHCFQLLLLYCFLQFC